MAAERERGDLAFSKGAYFLGKMVWAKGYRELIDLLAKHQNELEGFKLDVYGNGEDSHEVQSLREVSEHERVIGWYAHFPVIAAARAHFPMVSSVR